MKFRVLLLIFAIFLDCQFTSSNDGNYMFQHLSNEDGLIHNRVLSVLKDSKGFMWFGTMKGISRYDGYAFKNYFSNSNDTVILSNIMALEEDEKGRIWINASTNLYIYDPLSEKIISDPRKINQKLPRKINEFHKDQNGNIWIGTFTEGLFMYDVGIDSVVNLRTDSNNINGILSNNISDVYLDSIGMIYILTSEGMLQILNNLSYKNEFNFKISELSNEGLKFFVDKERDIWVYASAAEIGIGYYKNPLLNNGKIDFKKINTNSEIITGILQDFEGLIWIGADHGGINIYNKEKDDIEYLLNNPYDEKSVGDNTISSMFIDDIGMIWLGTFKHGVSFYHPSLFKFQGKKINIEDVKGSGINDIDNFVEDKFGNLWIGTNGGGLIYYNRKEDTFTQYIHDPENKNSLSANVVIGMLYDSKDRLWIGTYFGGLNLFDGKKFHHFKNIEGDTTSIQDDRIWDIYEDSRGMLWISTLLGGVNIFDPESKKVVKRFWMKNDSSLLKTNFVFSVIEDVNNNMWLATGIDLVKYLPEKDELIFYGPNEKSTRKISNEIVYEVLEDSRNLIWVATFDGLNVINPKDESIQTFTISDGLPSNTIVSILENDKGDIWVGTDNGLGEVILNYDYSRQEYKYIIRKYHLEDGLQSLEFNHKASFKTGNDELLFGGSNGFNIISSDIYNYSSKSLKPEITNFEIFNKSIKPNEEYNDRIIFNKSILFTDEIVLNYNENVISFEFSTLNYFHPDKIKYQYLLEGFNKEWLTTNEGVHKITYTNLNPGKYILRIRASDRDNNWSDQEENLQITILPPWWQKPWFRVLVIFLLITTFLGIFFLRLRNLRLQKIQLERLVKIRTSELEEKSKILQNQRDQLNNINKLLEERQQYIEEQSEELRFQKNKLEDSNTELNEINSLLEERQQIIEEQAEELRAQKEELQEANSNLVDLNSMKNKFFSIIAHDLKSPLGVVLGFSELLQVNMSKLPDSKKLMYSEKIYNSSRNINGLLENLLQWARTQTDNVVFEPATINLRNLMIQATTLLKDTIQSKKITIDFEDTEYPNVFADSNMIYTVIRNLLANAIKYSREGSKISVECVRKGNDMVMLSIKDQGIGISEEDKLKLFRIDRNISREGTHGETGTGLGLILCKEFVTKNGGEIWVESVENKGATFYFTLPGSEFIFKNKTERKSHLINFEPKKDILVVEDEPTNFYLLKKFLLSLKASIYWAKNGKEAINIIIQNDVYNIGLVLMDIRMPEMDGFESIKHIRKIDEHLPVIAQSAYIEDMDLSEILKKGFTDVLHKPLNKQIVLELAQKYLD